MAPFSSDYSIDFFDVLPIFATAVSASDSAMLLRSVTGRLLSLLTNPDVIIIIGRCLFPVLTGNVTWSATGARN